MASASAPARAPRKASDTPPIVVRGLSKRYGEIVAVDEVDLTVEEGDVYGYLGPNGAGKTTSMRMLLGLIRRSAGQVSVFGLDPQTDTRRALVGVGGFVEFPHFYGYLSARKNLELFGALDGSDPRWRKQHIEQVLDMVELSERGNSKVKTYSQGMKQRLGLAVALLRDPKLLILDEPTNGLDPGGLRDMHILIRRLADEGITILLSSHLLAEVEEICTRVAVINRAKIVFEGTLTEMRAGRQSVYRLRTPQIAHALELATNVPELEGVRNEGGDLLFSAAEKQVPELVKALVASDVPILAIIPEQATLESLFFELTEHQTPAEVLGV